MIGGLCTLFVIPAEAGIHCKHLVSVSLRLKITTKFTVLRVSSIEIISDLMSDVGSEFRINGDERSLLNGKSSICFMEITGGMNIGCNLRAKGVGSVEYRKPAQL